MTDKNIEMMKKLIEEKKQKSKSQRNDKRGLQRHGTQTGAIKKLKKGGLFDK